MPVVPSQTLPLFSESRRIHEHDRDSEHWQHLGRCGLLILAILFSVCTISWLGLLPDPSFAIRHRHLGITCITCGTGSSGCSSSSISVLGRPDNDTEDPEEVGTEAAWYGLKGGEHCLRYATREYTARLVVRDLDPAATGTSQDMMKLCKTVPAVIHGRTLFTDFCQDLGFNRGVWGFWIVSFEEGDCETKWGDFVDLGCAQSAIDDDQITPIRRIESHLENLQQGSSWQIMCVTTPAYVDGERFGYPDECLHSPSSGTYGVWDLEDDSCTMHHVYDQN